MSINANKGTVVEISDSDCGEALASSSEEHTVHENDGTLKKVRRPSALDDTQSLKKRKLPLLDLGGGHHDAVKVASGVSPLSTASTATSRSATAVTFPHIEGEGTAATQPTAAVKHSAAAVEHSEVEADAVLRSFDLDYRFGPCVGISRSRRWQRACKLGLKPPAVVTTLLQRESAHIEISVLERNMP